MKLRSFLEQIHIAVNDASNVLQAKNQDLIERYFDVVDLPDVGRTLYPKTVCIDFPEITEAGTIKDNKIDIPIITLLPIQKSKIEKAVFSSEFQIEEEKGELDINFSSKNLIHSTSPCKLEITIVPDNTTTGLKDIVDMYEEEVKRQIENK